MWATGSNNYGQLGDGTTTDRTTSLQVSGLSGITAIAGGGNHSLFLKIDGTVWATGYNGAGQLGDGTTTNRSIPVQVIGLSSITAIAGGEYHSLFLKNDGVVWATGDNYYGRLGDGTTTNRTTPVQLSVFNVIITSYQWYIGGIRIAEASASTYTATTAGNYTVQITNSNGCSSTSSAFAVTVTPNNTVAAASSAPTVCLNAAITNITHSTTGATGIGTPTGLPAGVSATWVSNILTINGTTTSAGTFNYSIPLIGGCGSISATGTITITPNNTVAAASSAPTVCLNAAITNITHSTTGATGIGTPTGLPAGVSATWVSNILTISGTPTATGTFNYSIPLMGGCGSVNATGTITVTPNNTVAAASSAPTVYVSTSITNITHSTTGATGIGTPTGLPAGISAAWATNILTISGTPTATGTFNYSIPLMGGCGSVNATGTIEVTIAASSNANLSDMTISVGTLSPSFASATTAYTASVSNESSSITVTPTKADATASITVNGVAVSSGAASGAINLNVGSNTITVVVTAQDASTKTYTIIITVTVTFPCLNQVTLISPSDDYVSETYFKVASSSAGKITATNKLTGTTNVIYRAKAIELNPGFKAESGTVFLAEIGGCN